MYDAQRWRTDGGFWWCGRVFWRSTSWPVEALAREAEPCGTIEDESGELSESINCGVGFFCSIVSVDPSESACIPQVPPEQSCE